MINKSVHVQEHLNNALKQKKNASCKNAFLYMKCYLCRFSTVVHSRLGFNALKEMNLSKSLINIENKY